MDWRRAATLMQWPYAIDSVKRHLADIEPDAELDRLAVAPDRLVTEFRLDLNGELQRLVGAFEQRENSIAGQVGDLAAVVADQRPEKLDRPGHMTSAAGLVLLHAPAERDHVGDHHGGALRLPLGADGRGSGDAIASPPDGQYRTRLSELGPRNEMLTRARKMGADILRELDREDGQ